MCNPLTAKIKFCTQIKCLLLVLTSASPQSSYFSVLHSTLQNSGIIERCRSEGTSEGHLVPSCWSEQGHVLSLHPLVPFPKAARECVCTDCIPHPLLFLPQFTFCFLPFSWNGCQLILLAYQARICKLCLTEQLLELDSLSLSVTCNNTRLKQKMHCFPIYFNYPLQPLGSLRSLLLHLHISCLVPRCFVPVPILLPVYLQCIFIVKITAESFSDWGKVSHL